VTIKDQTGRDNTGPFQLYSRLKLGRPGIFSPVCEITLATSIQLT